MALSVIRCWHAGTSTYLYFTVANIADPLAEYPGSYAAVAGTSDWILFDYNREGEALDPSILVTFAAEVADGYTCGIMGTGIQLSDPTPAVSGHITLVSGVARRANQLTVTGVYSAWCDSTCDVGDQMYVSATNPGMVTNALEDVSGDYILHVGTALTEKVSAIPGRINLLINPDVKILMNELMAAP